MNGVNKVFLLGALGRDPEVRYSPSGDAVCNLSLATSKSWKDRNTGELQEHTEWHRLVLFRRLAEIAGEYLKKGSKIHIEGELKTRKWEKDGVTHYTTEIVVNQLSMLDSRSSGAGEQAAAQQPRGGSGGQRYDSFADDEIPF